MISAVQRADPVKARDYYARDFAGGPTLKVPLVPPTLRVATTPWSLEETPPVLWPPHEPLTWVAFQRLLAQLHPQTKEKLTPLTKSVRRAFADAAGMPRLVYLANSSAGQDMALSAPKSVSILFLVLGDERIREAFMGACVETMAAAAGFARARVRRAQAQSDRATGNLHYVLFLHSTSRELDPHLHAHGLVLNLTWDPVEQRWKALKAQKLHRQLPYLQLRFDASLRAKLRALGYSLEGSGLQWGIRGVSSELVKKFSKSTEKIRGWTEAHEKEKGVAPSERVKKRISVKKRAKKAEEIDFPALEQSWQEQVRPWIDALGRLWEAAKKAVASRTADEPSTAQAAARLSLRETYPSFFAQVLAASAEMIKSGALAWARGIWTPEDLDAAFLEECASGALVPFPGRKLYLPPSHLQAFRELVVALNAQKGRAGSLFKAGPTTAPRSPTLRALQESLDPVVLLEVHGYDEGRALLASLAAATAADGHVLRHGVGPSLTRRSTKMPRLEDLLSVLPARGSVSATPVPILCLARVSRCPFSSLKKALEAAFEGRCRLVLWRAHELVNPDLLYPLRALEEESHLQIVRPPPAKSAAQDFLAFLHDPLHWRPNAGEDPSPAGLAQIALELWRKHGPIEVLVDAPAWREATNRSIHAAWPRPSTAQGSKRTVLERIEDPLPEHLADWSGCEFLVGTAKGRLKKGEILKVTGVHKNKLEVHGTGGRTLRVGPSTLRRLTRVQARTLTLYPGDFVELSAPLPGSKHRTGDLLQVEICPPEGGIRFVGGAEAGADFYAFDYAYASTLLKPPRRQANHTVIVLTDPEPSLPSLALLESHWARSQGTLTCFCVAKEKLRALARARRSAADLAEEEMHRLRQGRAQAEQAFLEPETRLPIPPAIELTF